MLETNLFVNYLLYLVTSLILLAVGVTIFVFTTKTKEFKLIGQGNTSAGVVLAGRTLGLAIILYSAVANSTSLLDLAIWAFVGILTQVLANYLAELLTPNFNVEEALEKDNIAVAISLAGMFISIGLIIAGCLTY